MAHSKGSRTSRHRKEAQANQPSVDAQRTTSVDFQLRTFVVPQRSLPTRCKLMETGLEMASCRKGWSFEYLWHVYKPLKRPSLTYDVTLAHFYAVMNRDLSEWKLWDKFLDGFDPKLFRTSGIAKESLRQNPRLIKPFFEWIVAERRNRLFIGTADGERDLVESPSRVRRRQSARKRMLLEFDGQQDLFGQKLQELFPELADLPQPPSFRQLLRSRSRK